MTHFACMRGVRQDFAVATTPVYGRGRGRGQKADRFAECILVYGRVFRQNVLYTVPGPKRRQARSASEVGKSFPRLRFGLVWDVSNLTGSGMRVCQSGNPAGANLMRRNRS